MIQTHQNFCMCGSIYCDANDSGILWEICSEAGSLGLSEVMGVGGDWLRGGDGESGGGVRRGGGEVQRGSGSGGDDGQEPKEGFSTVANITQYRDIS